AHVAGQGHGVPAGIDDHVTVVGDERVAVQRVPHPDGDSYRVGIVPDLDLVVDVADPGQPGHNRFGGGALRPEGHRAGQRHVAVPGGRLDAVRNDDVHRQSIVRRGGEHRVIPVVDVRQQHLQMIVHIGHAGD